ncbi:cytochrome P450 711A1-like [Oryza brachyantha]|uniref:cytochrome P450 711A1-like n=1 Tax=Oryza brachyantha TaxID=4533 RepID=UPI001ADC2F26|nr:cytochrome P450 711A1-like [Oryza brachyantha]XP_040376605.1 cytochrome P450 711A1-like [Oryza brachyantha]
MQASSMEASNCSIALEISHAAAPSLPVLLLGSSLALLTVFLVYFYAPFWSVRTVPGPPTRFPIGHLHLLAKNGPDVFRAIAKEYGPIFRFHMGRQPLVIVANAELCKEVGIKKFKDIRNRSTPPPNVGTLHQDALFLTRDSTWSSMRNMVIPLYQPARLAGLIPTMQSYVEALVDNIAGCPDQDCIPFCQLSLCMAIDIIGKTAFGIEFGLSRKAADTGAGGESGDEGDYDVREFLREYKKSMEFIKMDLSSSLSTILGLFLPCLQTPCKRLLRRVPGTADYKMDQNERRLCRRIDAIVAGRRRDRESRRGGGDGGGSPHAAALDFIAALLDARESGGHGGGREFALEDRHVRALAYEHLIAGTKTTAFTVSSVVYLVSCHPRVEEKLLREIDGFAPRGRAPDADELHAGLPYLDQIIKEAMRFHLVSPLIARETSEPVEIAGHLLPKGAYVWLAPGVLARDAAQFPEPEEFRPERFAPEAAEERARHPYAHIPFGIGPRACVGHRFALQQVKLAAVHLYRRYVFRHSPAMESPIQFDFDLVLGFRHGVKLRAIKRSHT